MKWIVCNGSPRGRKSNTALLLGHFLAGLDEAGGHPHRTYHLVRRQERAAAAAAFADAEAVLLAYPLYTDAMPAIVKGFLEELRPYRHRPGNPALLFLVQSGFPEGSHTEPVSRYHEKLARRLGCAYLGTLRRGGVEGIRVQPERWTRPLRQQMHALGRELGTQGRIAPEHLRALTGRERLSRWRLRIGAFLSEHLYWNRLLKGNGAYAERLSRPHDPGDRASRLT